MWVLALYPVVWAQYDTEQIARAAARHGIKGIVVTRFFKNSSSADNFVKSIRSSVITDLAENSGNIRIIDPNVTPDLAEEATLQGSPLMDNQSADALLVGNILSESGYNTSVCHLRLISLKDTRILCATYTTIPYPTVRSIENKPLPAMRMLKAPDFSRLRGVGVAVADMGNVNASHTTKNLRALAYAVSAMVRSNLALYERESLFLMMDEIKLRGSSVQFSNPQAKLVCSFSSDNPKIVRVVSMTDSSILTSITMSDASEPESANNVEQRNHGSSENVSGQPAVRFSWSDSGYTLTCTVNINKQMTVDEQTIFNLTHCDNLDTSVLNSSEWNHPREITDQTLLSAYGLPTIIEPSYPAAMDYTLNGERTFSELYRRILNFTYGNKKETNIILMGAILRGYEIDGVFFPGVLTILRSELYKRWTNNPTGKQEDFLNMFTWNFLEMLQLRSPLPGPRYSIPCKCQGYPSGYYENKQEKVCISYSLQINKNDLIPKTITLRISLLPMKKMLYKVERTTNMIEL